MKRKRPEKAGGAIRVGGIRYNFSDEQLAAIGAVAMAWNELEFVLDEMLGTAVVFQPAPFWVEICSRINGLDGKRELIYRAAKDANLPAPALAIIKDALDAFADYKTYRDAIIHARMTDIRYGIGERTQRRAEVIQILLTVEALKLIYDRLVILTTEMGCLLGVFYALRYMKGNGLRGAQDDPLTRRIAQEVQVLIAQARQHRSARRLLPPLPSFPV